MVGHFPVRCWDVGIFVVLFVGFRIVLSKNVVSDCDEKLFLHDRMAFSDSTKYSYDTIKVSQSSITPVK